jgi:hypothetical protein
MVELLLNLKPRSSSLNFFLSIPVICGLADPVLEGRKEEKEKKRKKKKKRKEEKEGWKVE